VKPLPSFELNAHAKGRRRTAASPDQEILEMMLDARVLPPCTRWPRTSPPRGCTLLLCCAAALVAAGCASEDRIVLAPPAGVDLSGEWVLDTNLSDDPTQVEESDKAPAASTRGDRDSSPSPFGKPGSNGPDNNPLPGNVTSRLHEENDSATATPVAVDESAMVNAPQRMSITQHGSELHIKSADADGKEITRDFTAGATQSIPWPRGGAQCSAGWRGPAFVVTTKPKKGREREDDYALDDQGHLILTIQSRKLDIKLVYGHPRT
jgi:hypothetical protein